MLSGLVHLRKDAEDASTPIVSDYRHHVSRLGYSTARVVNLYRRVPFVEESTKQISDSVVARSFDACDFTLRLMSSCQSIAHSTGLSISDNL